LGVLGLWFTSLLVEFYYEVTRRKDDEHQFANARLHYMIDVFYDGPLLVLVLISGFLLLTPAILSGIFLVKIVCACIAIGANAPCIIPVVLRKRAADDNNLIALETNSRLVDLSAVVGLPLGAVALAIGVYQSNLWPF
jgi:hypothetical protein